MGRGERMKNFKRAFDEEGISFELVSEALAYYKDDLEKMEDAYKRYKAAADAVAILNRSEQFTGVYDSSNVKRIDNKVNNRLNNPSLGFRRYVIARPTYHQLRLMLLAFLNQVSLVSSCPPNALAPGTRIRVNCWVFNACNSKKGKQKSH